MKYAADRPYSDPEKAARRLMEHAQAFEPIQDGRIYIEKPNGPFLYVDNGTPAEYRAGLDFAWLVGNARQRNVREANAKRSGPIRLILAFA
jgi:hypothetical protein